MGQLPDSWAFSAQSMQGCEELWQKGLYYSSLRVRFYHFSEASWPEQNCSVVKVFKEKSKIAECMSQFSYSKTQCETIDTPRGPTKTPWFTPQHVTAMTSFIVSSILKCRKLHWICCVQVSKYDLFLQHKTNALIRLKPQYPPLPFRGIWLSFVLRGRCLKLRVHFCKLMAQKKRSTRSRF